MSNRQKRWRGYMSLLSCDFPGLYSTGVKGSALNGFDICSDTKLGPFYLGCPPKLIGSFVTEEVGSVPTLLHCTLFMTVGAHFDLPGFWDRCTCRVNPNWFTKPYMQFYFCGHCGLKRFDILQPLPCWKTHLDCLTCCTNKILSNDMWRCVKIMESRPLAAYYWWNS